MKRIRPVMLAMLLIVMVISVTACGTNSDPQSTTSAGQSSTAASSAAGGAESTSRMDDNASGMEETSEGIIGGVADDVERGAKDLGDSVRDMTGNTGSTLDSTSHNDTAGTTR